MSQESNSGASMNGAESKEMTQEAIDLLRIKIGEAAKKMGEGLDIRQDDIDLVTKAIVIGAERSGNPLTKQEIEMYGTDLQQIIFKGLGRRLEVRPGINNRFLVINNDTLEYISGANSAKEVGDILRIEREMGR